MVFDIFSATQLWRGKVADIAKDYRGVLTFAVADEDKMSDVFKEFGFDDSSEEINIGIIDKNEKKYPMEPMEEFDSDLVREFLDRFVKGKLHIWPFNMAISCLKINGLSPIVKYLM